MKNIDVVFVGFIFDCPLVKPWLSQVGVFLFTAIGLLLLDTYRSMSFANSAILAS